MSTILRRLGALTMRAILRVYHRLEIVGRRHLPTHGPFILVSNHTSHLDAPSLLAALPLRDVDRAHPAAAADYFFSKRSVAWLVKTFLNAVPFERQPGHGRHALKRCRRMLDAGHVLVLFPEGTRSPDGSLGRFRSGVARLAMGTGVPIIPCYLEGGTDAWPKGKLLPRPAKLRLVLGTPRTFPENSDGTSAPQICADLRRAVETLGNTRPR